ncbi:MAG: acylphosphatase [Parcubacteria group bacterium]|jgi:acylphosphatase
MPRLLRLKIYGHVQGVGFRYEAMRKAQELGLVGFARNEKDHTVYIEAQGDDTTRLNEFLHWCTLHGPSGARIERVESNYANEPKSFVSFKVVS